MYEDIFSELITKIVNIDHQFILTGTNNGDVVLWQLISKGGNFNFQLVRNFSGHVGAIDKLILLPEHRFASLCSQEKNVRIWDINSGKCEKILNLANGTVTVDSNTEISLLSNGLMVVSGAYSVARVCFDVWDTVNNTCIFQKEGIFYRPEGISFLGKIGPDILVRHTTYNAALTIWKITRSECFEITSCKDHAYAMHIGPRGEIITAGSYNIQVYKLNSKNDLELSHQMTNDKAITGAMLVGDHQLLTFDTRFGADRIKLRDYYLPESGAETVLGDCLLPSGELATPQCFLEQSNLLLFIHNKKLHLKTLPINIQDDKNLAEIRKNSRMLYQSYVTQTGLFSHLPLELNVKIAGMTGGVKDMPLSEKIARDHFCKP